MHVRVSAHLQEFSEEEKKDVRKKYSDTSSSLEGKASCPSFCFCRVVCLVPQQHTSLREEQERYRKRKYRPHQCFTAHANATMSKFAGQLLLTDGGIFFWETTMSNVFLFFCSFFPGRVTCKHKKSCWAAARKLL